MPLLIHHKELDKAERIQLFFSYILQSTIFLALLFSLWQHSWLNAFAVAGILLLSFLPKFIRHNYKVFLPVEFDFLAILFVFATIFLGEIHAYYTRYWWWDAILHTSSGFLLGTAGFLLVHILNREPKIHLKMKPGFVSLFAFTFALAVGGVWEIFEFGMDSAFGFHMQKSGLTDTMWDLIVDAAGAAIIAILGYFYTRKGEFLLFDRMVHRFVERNPRIFLKTKS